MSFRNICITEASLMPFSVASRDRWGKSRCLFPSRARPGSETAGRQGVGRLTARRVVQGFKSGEDLKACPFLSFFRDSADVIRPTLRHRGIRPVQIHSRAGGCLDSFCLHADALAMEGRLASTTCSGACFQDHVVQTNLISLAVVSKWGEKESGHRSPSRGPERL